MCTHSSNPNDDRARFFKALNGHGYPFHYAVVRRAIELNETEKSEWAFEACEFPVNVRGAATRIDFILQSRHRTPYMLIAECKRADPKFSKWCFIRARFVRRERTVERFAADRIERRYSCEPRATLDILDEDITANAYHIGIALKDVHKKGDPNTSDHDAIEKALTQVCRAVNGMAETIKERVCLLPEEAGGGPSQLRGRTLIPVIFTTARLYVCEHDLSTADISTGTCSETGAKLTEVDWLCFQYHLSPGIKHTVTRSNESYQIADLLDNEYVRTIPIVSSRGIDSFLATFKPWAEALGPP